jgi:hypothetical protein
MVGAEYGSFERIACLQTHGIALRWPGSARSFEVMDSAEPNVSYRRWLLDVE